MPDKRRIFITGGTGYMGSRLIPLLTSRGHDVTALVRPGSERKLSGSAVKTVSGDALQPGEWMEQVRGSDTFVHLIGVANPGPAKAAQFRKVDLVSVQVAVKAAAAAGVKHFVYLSVAHPAPVMKAYIFVRIECEEMIRASGMAATFLRPWYVLGPGHWWPYALIPFYWLAGLIPPLQAGARRLGLVKLPQMLAALVQAAENPPDKLSVVGVPGIKDAGAASPLRY